MVKAVISHSLAASLSLFLASSLSLTDTRVHTHTHTHTHTDCHIPCTPPPEQRHLHSTIPSFISPYPTIPSALPCLNQLVCSRLQPAVDVITLHTTHEWTERREKAWM